MARGVEEADDALGRFDVGVPDALGCGNFPLSVADALKEARLAVSDGILLNDPGQPLDLADRVYVLEEGSITFQGSAEEADSDERLREIFLGM